MFRNPIVDAIVVLLIVLLIFGPKRLPELGKGLGQGMREFKEGISNGSKEDDKPAITPMTQVSEPAPVQRAAEPSSDLGGERLS
jgi:sec-independent protein translocase protein TatA